MVENEKIISQLKKWKKSSKSTSMGEQPHPEYYFNLKHDLSNAEHRQIIKQNPKPWEGRRLFLAIV